MKTSLNMDEKLEALLCYLLHFACCAGLIFCIVVLVKEKQSKLSRFSAVQSLILMIGGSVIASVIQVIPVIGQIVGIILGLGVMGLGIFLAIKAYKGEMYKLPMIGDLADQWSN